MVEVMIEDSHDILMFRLEVWAEFDVSHFFL